GYPRHASARLEFRRRDPAPAGRLSLARRAIHRPDSYTGRRVSVRSISAVQAMILCGGLGTRLAEETEIRPKPMVEIGGRPILWHIMKLYSHFGIMDFILCLGYKGDMIRDYFLNYSAMNSDVRVHIGERRVEHLEPFHAEEKWRVLLAETGLSTQTGGRIHRAGKGQLAVFRHEGYWRPMDTMRERRAHEEEWASGKPPWKVW